MPTERAGTRRQDTVPFNTEWRCPCASIEDFRSRGDVRTALGPRRAWGDVVLLFERENELAAVVSALREARSGEGRGLVVTGPSGIGKTGLLAAATELGREAGFCVCRAAGSELERDLGWGVVRLLFAEVVREASTVAGELLAGAAGLARPPLGLAGGGAGPDELSASLHGLYWLVANLSERRPLLLAVDDAHWADAASLRFLQYLARRVADLPVLLAIGTPSCDLGAVEPERRLVADATVLELAPLGVAAAGRLLSAVFGEDVAPAFVRACHTATGGNPFLLGELAAQLLADRIEPTETLVSRVGEVSPRSVAQWVARRLSHLGVQARRLAEAVAVLGESAELAHAAALAGLDAARAADIADALFAAHVLRAGAPLEFVHPLVRAAVYGEMRPLVRQSAHASAARRLAHGDADRDAIAAQLLHVSPAGDDWVVETLLASGASARERGAPEAAVAALERALDEPPRPELVSDVLLQLGAAEAELAAPGAVEHLQAAHARAADPRSRARAALVLMDALTASDRVAEAFELGRRALAELDGSDRELDLQLEATTINCQWQDSSVSGAGSDRAGGTAEPAGNSLGGQLMLIARAQEIAFAASEPVGRVTGLLTRALTDGPSAPGLREGSAFWRAMHLLHITDQLDLAEGLEREVLQRARERGLALALSRAATWQGHACLQRGSVREAEAATEYADGLSDQARGHGDAVRIHIRAEALLEQGRLAEAAVEIGRLDASGPLTTLLQPLHVLYSRGRLRAAQGRFEEALSDFTDVGRASSTPNPAVLPWRCRAASALAALGRRAEARGLLAEELDLARRFGVARPIGLNLRISGLVEGGDRGIELLRESVTTLRDCPARLELAHSLVELGSALRRCGRRADALPFLRDGLALAERAGASALVERAQHEHADAGARPHRPAHLGRDTLTPSELRVANMAGDGASNKQIAQALFVSLRTVETHLTHAYAKLDISARGELAAALAARETETSGGAFGEAALSTRSAQRTRLVVV